METLESTCLICINFSPEISGCAPYNADLAQLLVSEGKKVTVVTSFQHYPDWRIPDIYRKRLRESQTSLNLDIHRLRIYVPSKPSAIKRALYEISFAIHASYFLRKAHFDQVVVVVPSLLSLIPGMILKRKGAKLKTLVQDIMSSSAIESETLKIRSLNRYLLNLESFLLKRNDYIATISNEAKRKIVSDLGIDESKVVLSPNYSLIPKSKQNPDLDRHYFHLPASSRIVLYTGNFGRKQGLLNLIKAVKLLENRRPEILFLLVGNGIEGSIIFRESRLLSNILIRDFIEDSLYASLLRTSDLLLVHELGSLKEMSFPSKLTSYFQAEKPILVVCSKESATYSAVSEHKLLYCEPDNPQALADYLANLDFKFEPKKYEFDTNEIRSRRMEWLKLS